MKSRVIFPELVGQRYECDRCAKGCRELTVHLTERDRKIIDRQGWKNTLDVEPYVRLGRGYALNHKPNDECVFLRADGLCRIHADFGLEDKPLACQLYPFTLEPEGDILRVSVRFDCPSIARSTGHALGQYKREIRRLASELKTAAPQRLRPLDKPTRLTSKRDLSVDELDALVAHLDGWVSDTSRTIDRRLRGLYELTETLATARTGTLDENRFIELVALLVSDLPNAIEADGDGLPPPSARQNRLLAQAVFAHCESVTLRQARLPFFRRISYRLDQLKRARQLCAAQGNLPSLVKGRCGGTFAAIGQVKPHPELAAHDCDQLLTRYLRARVLGRTVFGQAYHNWPVLDGLRALLLAMAVTGWLTRYLALTDGRLAYTYDDLVEAIGVVDRHAARSPELGSRPARLRVTYLSQEHGLLRLLHAYPMVPEGTETCSRPHRAV